MPCASDTPFPFLSSSLFLLSSGKSREAHAQLASEATLLAHRMRDTEKHNSSLDLKNHFTYITACCIHGQGVLQQSSHFTDEETKAGASDILNTTCQSGVEPRLKSKTSSLSQKV